tara:strand:- start:15907 stop:16218 length:312 start_codon:yes stop_codon:yes gene_type:complete
MRKELILNKLDDKLLITVIAEVATDVWLDARKHILLRQDLTPATYELLPPHGNKYMKVYIDGLGEFFLDQLELVNDSIRVVEVLGVDTSNMDNDALWLELQKL